MPRSLEIGTKYGKYLCTIHNKPFIPIHHMEAHALTARMFSKDVEFPFLVLLISGGHCLLAIVRGVDDFLLMGQTLNNSPGEVFDKVTESHPNYLGTKVMKIFALDSQMYEVEKHR